MTGVLESELVRPDARAKAGGRARYTQDIYPAGVVHGAVVPSPHASARIVRVDVAAARAIDDVAAVLVAADLPDTRYGIMSPDEPILARERVRYVGEPVALVAAHSAAAARAAAAAVAIDYEPADAVTDLTAAAQRGAPQVHAGRDNVIYPGGIERGDVAAAFARAELVVETRIVSHRAHQAYIEPRAALAELGDDGRLVVTTTSQAPFEVRTGICGLFRLAAADVRVRVPALGGGFGGKLHLGMAPFAVALCLATRMPVQVVCSRSAEMQSPAPRENSIVEIASAVGSDGRILGRRTRILLDSGAYAYDTPALAATAALQGCGPYDIETVSIEAASVYTNTVPTGSFRAPTGPQMAYANECHIEEIAARTGSTGVAVRRRNIVGDESLGPAGQRIDDPGMTACLERAATRMEEWRSSARREPRPGVARGLGLACAWWNTFPGSSAAVVTMHEDASVTLHTGATEIGTGAVSTALGAIVADELAIDPARVRLVSADTEEGPYDFGSQGSRTMYAAGAAAAEAAGEIRDRLLADVAAKLEVDAADLELTGEGIGVRGVPTSRVPLAEAAAGALLGTGPLVASASFQPSPPEHDAGCVRALPFAAFNEPTYHCHLAEIEVDLATGLIRVTRYLAVHDVGPVLNPAGVRGQIEGGVVQGIGYAVFEEILTDDRGRTINDSLVDYRLPTIADIPDELEISLVSDHPGLDGPRGAKGIGEAPIILPAATIGSAVRDALGVQPLALPLSAARIRAAIAEHEAAAGGGS